MSVTHAFGDIVRGAIGALKTTGAPAATSEPEGPASTRTRAWPTKDTVTSRESGTEARVSLRLWPIAAATVAAAGLMLAVLVSGGADGRGGTRSRRGSRDGPAHIPTLVVFTDAEPTP